ncbi:mpv17-like protein 2 [Leptotrombidium deliense]|uniref:Mpv17-like protein 2 n=1 Tax=Leptotrombidium deliense TaxID=299467 RepID=A0A443SS92_9ACAR|nr:mpv17-like protein 2 [Leptotrombidium deliense]
MTAAVLQYNFLKLSRFVNSTLFGKTNLLLTNAFISTALGAAGDCIQQQFDIVTNKCERRDGLENQFVWRRTFHMSCAGLTTGLVTHYWYIILDRFLGNKRCLVTITKKVLWDQIIFSPINLSVYFVTLGLCEKSNVKKVKEEIIEKGFEQIYVAEWFIWPPSQFLNFYLIPLRYRMLFDNIISLGFDIYSPYVKYKTQLKSENL